ncbi:MAG TPA: hypothetical protein ENH31_00990, partial [Nitrospirae bacterium]|nr:hypothetical protein [Nitrospirota bacterium]HDK81128.1 hypothetical protein [Nitrospirota bacterium]
MHKTRVSVLAAVLLFLLLFSVFAYSYLSLDLWDYDFWWHISTGRLIVETGSLPDADPFSFVSTLQENENLRPKWENFVLKQYWLCQILFYFIFIKAGPAGIIILRTALLLLTILVVLWQLRRWGVSFYICFVLVFLLFLVTTQFTGERPVLFSILFTPVVFIMLEDFKHRRGKLLYLLPPLMLLWANIHGGFIIGNIMIMVYMA